MKRICTASAVGKPAFFRSVPRSETTRTRHLRGDSDNKFISTARFRRNVLAVLIQTPLTMLFIPIVLALKFVLDWVKYPDYRTKQDNKLAEELEQVRYSASKSLAFLFRREIVNPVRTSIFQNNAVISSIRGVEIEDIYIHRHSILGILRDFEADLNSGLYYPDLLENCERALADALPVRLSMALIFQLRITRSGKFFAETFLFYFVCMEIRQQKTEPSHDLVKWVENLGIESLKSAIDKSKFDQIKQPDHWANFREAIFSDELSGALNSWNRARAIIVKSYPDPEDSCCKELLRAHEICELHFIDFEDALKTPSKVVWDVFEQHVLQSS